MLFIVELALLPLAPSASAVAETAVALLAASAIAFWICSIEIELRWRNTCENSNFLYLEL